MSFTFSLPPCRLFLRGVLIGAGTAILLAGCASVKPVGPEVIENAGSQGSSAAGIHFELIYVIHGDANYTYHDSTGLRHAADSEAVAQALDVAKNSPHSEVFVFYQTPRPWRMFGVNPDGIFYQYRRGVLVRRETYSRAQDSDFQTEADLFHKHDVHSDSLTRFFTYFGHEIPASGRVAYSESYPDRMFSLAEFTRGVDHFARRVSGDPYASFSPSFTAATVGDSGDGKPFGLMVLSVCYGGTPAILSSLSSYTDYVLASPAYLHLSFLDTRAFKRLSDSGSAPFDTAKIHALAKTMARQSFEKLKENTQTEITVAVYNVQKTAFPKTFRDVKGWKTSSLDYHDCSEDPGFDSASAKAGVEVYYRAARFGPLKDKSQHSGWECPGSGEEAP